ncbi:MAG: bifunctional diaminohydroxyphosphoribosylaminopyrimidine deaminase/5-amino-6-(5-phosphoribosylamino)uracil reductase RibD [Rhodospirillaceae bacterium]|nr:bifunctional diaminohydroxyphosphoribosylaminopyrimidine deaminase/5-amino-6-(5-phosphoribosylamino)uracil reductase RibD [Rhodospirillaceae bacterium]MBT4219101.1 bifunctional diaminohydroxyphosphoribosylaminopyrimidine deaminase/5-amino-6-(5-phosphoribosylamino)uracil reductase RibD [Rhodospirillaceae bacterium]MBT5308587.1 bifunctional diaminohydroxyphosphoribosylaminopyrimidine deaminase/5-amino-6-(5-phosphoribosylamino)uracil reductase RibD [Rhodospirillaceae bacterium]MBT6407772.1 bifun
MRTALTLARRGIGMTAPNPSVGCVVVDSDGHVAGRGWTAVGGRPHGETVALQRAGDKARGGTAYVTFEPCSHQGKTPPCAQVLIDSRVARVVIACTDPDSRVSGKGAKMLKAAGIKITEGVLKDEALALNAGFITRVGKGRPSFTLKAATSLDGRIATRSGDSQWITGEESRLTAHMLRARHDAIMVGIGTALSDNPSLTCRLGGMDAYSPVRIVADSSLRLPLSSTLVETAGKVPTWIVCSTDADENTANALIKKNVHIVRVEASSAGRPRPEAIAQAIGERGLTRVLIEGGGKLAGEFLHADLVDHLAWYHAPMLIGGDGIPSAAAFGVEKLGKAPAYVRSGLELVGRDLYETYQRDDGKKT